MSTRKPGKPTLSPTEVERVLEALRKSLDAQHKNNQSSLARALGVEPSAINQLLSGKNQPSLETAKALGKHTGQDFRQWLDPAPGGERGQNGAALDPLPLAEAPPRAFYTRDEWQHLLDPALEVLIREGNSAGDSRAGLDAAVAFTTSNGTKPTLDDVLRFARTLIKEKSRDSGKMRKGKHK
jgi:transcriptional regulator with XRE-family HTH domain